MSTAKDRSRLRQVCSDDIDDVSSLYSYALKSERILIILQLCKKFAAMSLNDGPITPKMGGLVTIREV